MHGEQVTRLNLYFSAALPLAMCVATSPASAQDIARQPEAAPPVLGDTPTPTHENEVTFSATNLEYDNDADVVTASGDVRMFREGYRLRAEKVVWNRKTGQVQAQGDVAVVSPGGDTAYGDTVDLTDTLRDGVVENLLVVLEDGGRMAAQRGTREGDVFTLQRGVFSPCRVVDENGCPRAPSWKITADRVTYDAKAKRVRYVGARMELFGIPIIPLPGLRHPTGNEAGSGLLVPNIRLDRVNGLEVATPYYLRIASDRDLTITPHLYTDALPMVEAQFRALTDLGAFQVTGFGTYGRRQSLDTTVPDTSTRDFRGYFDASGRLQLDPYWSLSGSVRVTTDRTFLRRYDITREDRLRSTINVERIDDSSYFSLAGWAVQTLRAGARQGLQPIALPVIDYRKRLTDPLLGGTIEFQGNTLFLTRTHGQDTQRAFAGVRWDLRKITPMGQEITFTAATRTDAYHTDEVLSTLTEAYRGDPGWNFRSASSFAVDVRWPFVGQAFGGTQRLTPRVQVVASPVTGNMRVPNEDARAVDLEDSNLFALNRFNGYDRYENGARVTYGVEWALDRPGLSISSIVGQSYRLTDNNTLFPDGTGLSSRTSDIVGRTKVKFQNLVSLTHRFRLDKDNLAIRRNEIDATVGSNSTYATVGYMRLNRNIGPELEDLRDSEEIRLGGRVQLARYWSVFGSTTINLTNSKSDPTSIADGFDPVRHRLGLSYEDECLEIGVTWRRDYANAGDARRGNSYLFRVAFKQLGR